MTDCYYKIVLFLADCLFLLHKSALMISSWNLRQHYNKLFYYSLSNYHIFAYTTNLKIPHASDTSSHFISLLRMAIMPYNSFNPLSLDLVRVDIKKANVELDLTTFKETSLTNVYNVSISYGEVADITYLS